MLDDDDDDENDDNDIDDDNDDDDGSDYYDVCTVETIHRSEHKSATMYKRTVLVSNNNKVNVLAPMASLSALTVTGHDPVTVSTIAVCIVWNYIHHGFHVKCKETVWEVVKSWA